MLLEFKANILSLLLQWLGEVLAVCLCLVLPSLPGDPSASLDHGACRAASYLCRMALALVFLLGQSPFQMPCNSPISYDAWPSSIFMDFICIIRLPGIQAGHQRRGSSISGSACVVKVRRRCARFSSSPTVSSAENATRELWLNR